MDDHIDAVHVEDYKCGQCDDSKHFGVDFEDHGEKRDKSNDTVIADNDGICDYCKEKANTDNTNHVSRKRSIQLSEDEMFWDEELTTTEEDEPLTTTEEDVMSWDDEEV